MIFIGIDLAWSTRNGSGVAVIEGDKNKASLFSYGIAYSDKDIIDYVRMHSKNKDAFIAIDAPLIVPNQTGRRLAEVKVGELFRKYNAGAHPANRQRLSMWTGTIRGEEISKLLENENFSHSPYIKSYEKSRKFFEVYPHPSMVVLFNLEKILQYKAKPKRDYEFRWNEFKKYQNHLRKLPVSFPKNVFPDVTKLRAKALKEYEDKLDGIFCAYLAYYCWAHPENCEVLGNMKQGYILTPVK